jgi:hypothetical protein
MRSIGGFSQSQAGLSRVDTYGVIASKVVVSDSQNTGRRPTRPGFLNPQAVRALAFWTTSTCILVAVVACLLAIWQFTGTDVLWRTVATCAVVGGGTIAFSWINTLFGDRAE